MGRWTRPDSGLLRDRWNELRTREHCRLGVRLPHELSACPSSGCHRSPPTGSHGFSRAPAQYPRTSAPDPEHRHCLRWQAIYACSALRRWSCRGRRSAILIAWRCFRVVSIKGRIGGSDSQNYRYLLHATQCLFDSKPDRVPKLWGLHWRRRVYRDVRRTCCGYHSAGPVWLLLLKSRCNLHRG